MLITKKSAKGIVRDLLIYEEEMTKKFKGNKNSNEYLKYLKDVFRELTLEKIDDRNYILVKIDNAKNPIVNRKNKEGMDYLNYYFLELSNSISVYGLVHTYDTAQKLFNEIFGQ